MLFVNTAVPNKFKCPAVAAVHKFKAYIIILAKTGTLLIYNNNLLEREIQDVSGAAFKNELVCYVAERLYVLNLLTGESTAFDRTFGQVLFIGDKILGYTDSTFYLLDYKKGSFLQKQLIVNDFKANDSMVFTRLNDDMYVLNMELEFAETFKFDSDIYGVNNKYIAYISNQRCVFVNFKGKFMFESRLSSVDVYKLALTNNYLIFLSGNTISINKIEGSDMKCIKEFKCTQTCNQIDFTANQPLDDIENLINKTEDLIVTKNEWPDFYASNDEDFFIIEENRIRQCNFTHFECEDLAINFDAVYPLKDLYFGIIENKVYFYDNAGIFLEKIELDGPIEEIRIFDKICIKVLKNVDSLLQSIYLIDISIPIHTKILHHELILNIEKEFYVYKEKDLYYLNYYGKEIVKLCNQGDFKKIIKQGNEIITLDNENRVLEYNDIMDFYFLHDKLILLMENNVRVFRDGGLIGDILIDFVSSVYNNEYLYLKTIDKITIMNDTIVNYDITCDKFYISGDTLCLKIHDDFVFVNDLAEYNEKDEVALKRELNERNVALVQLTEDSERIAGKAKKMEKLAKDIERKSKRFWFF